MTGQHTSGSLIYMYDSAAGEALGKRESHTPRIDAPAKVKPDEIFDLKVTVGPHPLKSTRHSHPAGPVYAENGSDRNNLRLYTLISLPGTIPEYCTRISQSR
jgi:superoxide reductase